MRQTGRARRTAAPRGPLGVAGALVLAAALAGCGIRSTGVPTDFGAAPTRVGCTLSGSDVTPRAAGEFPVQVYLVCTSQLVTVDRTIRLGHDRAFGRVGISNELLAQLTRKPTAEESRAGYSSEVRKGLKVTGPHAGDPSNALRLTTSPDDLSPVALAQIVCTLANNKVTTQGDEKVTLGGPGDDPLRTYACTDALKARPGFPATTGQTIG
ncbi:hypothetical protein [Streptomyces beihaiensis]|uniref:Lipoprotein n=1 Tax=Streptomyces beihaiensis TaxID=2984495 RepID=A0ABT3TRH7_9ACTN|nr:hypothetical protein [Streptomyces beihaiensis]MCX3059370.1 hypothetical protein [Streptomyces beihaiensis]